MDDDDRHAAACARSAREKDWTGGERDKLAELLASEGRRRALSEHPRRMEFVERASAEMLGKDGPAVGTLPSGPDEVEVRVVGLRMAEGLAAPEG